MKTHPISPLFSSSVAAALLAFALLPAGQAGTLYWEPAGAGVPDGGTGTWNTTTALWSTDALGTSYTTWQAGSTANMGNTTGTVTIGANLDVGGINFGTTALTLNGDVAGREITLSGSSPVLNAPIQYVTASFGFTNPVKIGGTSGFTKTGLGALQISGNIVHTLSGNVDIQLGEVIIQQGKLTSVNEWYAAPTRDENVNMNAGFGISTLQLGTSFGASTSRVGANSTIKLRGGGVLDQKDASAAVVTDSFGTLDVQNSLGQILANTTTATLTINTAFNRGTRGTLNFQNLDNASADVTIADAATGRPDDGVTLPWAINTGQGATTDKNRFVKFNHATDSFAVVASTAVTDSNLANWTYNNSALDLHMDIGTGGEAAFTNSLASDQTLNTLMVGRTDANAGTLNLGGRTLKVNALALNNTVTVSNGTVSGNGGSQLYIHTGPNSAGTIFSAKIGGTNDVILSTGLSSFAHRGLEGAEHNTYTGTMYIQGFGMYFSGAGQKVTGDLFIGESTTLGLAASNQIADSGVVDVGARGMLHLGGAFETSAVSETVKGITGMGTVDLGSVTDANNRSLTVDTAGSSYTFDGRIAGGSTHASAKVEKAGLGTWTLTGANVYSQKTVVSGGRLLVNGSHVNPTAGRGYTVSTSGTLGGTGSITLTSGTLAVASGGVLAPGASVGSLAVTATKLTLAGTLAVEFDGTTSDLLTLAGDLDLSGGVLSLNNFGAGAVGNHTYTIASYSTLTGTFNWPINNNTGLSLDATYGTGGISYGDGSNDAITVRLIPEPSTYAMLLGCLGVSALLRRQRFSR